MRRGGGPRGAPQQPQYVPQVGYQGGGASSGERRPAAGGGWNGWDDDGGGNGDGWGSRDAPQATRDKPADTKPAADKKPKGWAGWDAGDELPDEVWCVVRPVGGH